MKAILYLSCLATFLAYTYAYEGTVLSYSPVRKGSPNETLLHNLNLMITEIPPTSNIAVLPEYGLTGVDILDDGTWRDHAIVVPSIGTTPCSDRDNNHKVLVDLSCKSQSVNAYLVVNLLEKSGDYYYNTNLIFHKNGTLIEKYRKINLYGTEASLLRRGDRMVTFETDFGAKFTTFTCYDILFKYPAVDVLTDLTVTDVAFPTAWFSELPQLHSISIQEGYSTRHGVNFLAAGYNRPAEGASGSGVYSASGSKNVFVSTGDGTKQITHTLNVLAKRNPERTCTKLGSNSDGEGRFGGQLPSFEDFRFKYDIRNNPDQYSFYRISNSSLHSKQSLCSNDELVCCDFETNLQSPYDASNFTMKYMVYSNGTTFGCALVGCTFDANSNCSIFNTFANEVRYENITIKSTTLSTDNEINVPSTLNAELLSIDYYEYCYIDGQIEIKSNYTRGVLSFGFYGISSSGVINTAVSHIVLGVIALFLFKYFSM